MDKDKKTKGMGWGKVPHGIVDAAIPDTMKLLLWYGYDKSDYWAFSVAEVSRSLGKTRQYIRACFRKFVAGGVFTQAGTKKVKHGEFLVYSFHRERVDAFVKSQLKMDPETDPEYDPETDPETNREYDPDFKTPTTKNDLPRLNTKNDCTENKGTKEKSASPSSSMPLLASQSTSVKDIGSQPTLASVAPVQDKGSELDEEFEKIWASVAIQPTPPLIPEGNTPIKEKGSQPPLAAVAPVQDNGAGFLAELQRSFNSGLYQSPSLKPEGIIKNQGNGSQPPSGSVTPNALQSPGLTLDDKLKVACGNPNAAGNNKQGKGMVPVSSAIIQPSASGEGNIAAIKNTTGHSTKSANGASGTSAQSGGFRGGLSEAMADDIAWLANRFIEKWKTHPFSKASGIIMEAKLLDALAKQDWDNLPSFWTPLHAVRDMGDKIQKEFGRYS